MKDNRKPTGSFVREDAIDPALESLLDEALTPADAPAGLNDRVMSATRHRLPRRRGVLGRIGLTPVWQAAAVAALAGLLGWALVTVLSPDHSMTSPRLADRNTATPMASSTTLNETEQRELLAAFAAAHGIDFDAYWLERRLALSVEPGGAIELEEAMWRGSDDPVDMLLDTYEVQWLGAESEELYF